jgi:signal peptidase I
MTGDDWWEQAVDQFGLEVVVPPLKPVAVDVTAEILTPDFVTAGGVTTAVKKPVRRRRRRLAVDWLVIAVCALAAAFLLRTFVIQQFAVDGQSMLGTLHSGDRVIVNKLSYDLHDPRHGDIVVLKDIKNALEERDLIKRVIALPGETIEYRNCELFIDGTRIVEPYLDPVLVTADHCGDSQDPVKVEAGHVFVMGDNRAASLDSRTVSIGQIPYDHLIGRAFLVVWPHSDWGWL